MPSFSVTVVRRGRAKVAVPPNVKIVDIPLPTLGTLGRSQFGLLKAVINASCYVIVATLVSVAAGASNRCGTIHGRFLFPEGVVAYLTSFALGARLVITSEGFDVNLYLNKGIARSVLSIISRRAELVTVSEPMRDLLNGLGYQAKLIPNFADGDLFRFVPIERKERQIVFVGTLDENKRPAVLLEAVDGIREYLAAGGIRVRIVGDGPLRRQLEEMVDDHHLRNVVVFDGYLPHSQVKDLMARSYLFVNCSRTEGSSLAMIEAMASGCLVVAADIPANRSLIHNGETGFLFSGDDPRALSRLVEHAFEDSLASGRITSMARSYFESVLDLKTVAYGLSNLYMGDGDNPHGRA
jgi:L-malate glycosyltransferase